MAGRVTNCYVYEIEIDLSNHSTSISELCKNKKQSRTIMWRVLSLQRYYGFIVSPFKTIYTFNNVVQTVNKILKCRLLLPLRSLVLISLCVLIEHRNISFYYEASSFTTSKC